MVGMILQLAETEAVVARNSPKSAVLCLWRLVRLFRAKLLLKKH